METWTPAEADGPGDEWYRELSESAGTAWPRPHSMIRADLAVMRGREAAAIRQARDARAGIIRLLSERGVFGPPWTCPRCGGPRILPDLESTLPYRQCGYAETPAGWVHE